MHNSRLLTRSLAFRLFYFYALNGLAANLHGKKISICDITVVTIDNMKHTMLNKCSNKNLYAYRYVIT